MSLERHCSQLVAENSPSPGSAGSAVEAVEAELAEREQELSAADAVYAQLAEEIKREAKMERELVAIEKLMEEREKKRQRRDEGLPEEDDAGGTPGKDETSQNELF